MQTRTEKWGFWPLFSYPYRFHHATEAVLQPNGGCFTMQNRLRCSVTQAPLQPKRIFDCVLNLYTFRANFVSLSFSTIYEHAHISPVRTEKNFGSEFLNLRGAIVRKFQNHFKSNLVFLYPNHSSDYKKDCIFAFRIIKHHIYKKELSYTSL